MRSLPKPKRERRTNRTSLKAAIAERGLGKDRQRQPEATLTNSVSFSPLTARAEVSQFERSAGPGKKGVDRPAQKPTELKVQG